VPATDDLARHRSVSIEELAKRPLIVLSAGHGTRRVFDNAIAEAGLAYDIAAEANVGHVAQAMAVSGHGVAVVTDDRRYGLKPVFIDTTAGRLMLPLFAAWNPSHYAVDAIEALVDDLATYAQTRYGSRKAATAPRA
jgi:DNA-binding transcriptional LysR family regulator